MKSVEEIIQEKAYNQLSSEERALVSELVDSEIEYNEMKYFLSTLESMSVTEVVNPEIKSSLNQIFQSKHSGIQQNWKVPIVEKAPIIPIYRRTWFHVAALLLLFVGIFAIWLPISTNFNNKEATVVAENKTMSEQKSTTEKEAQEFTSTMNDALEMTVSNTATGTQETTQSGVSEINQPSRQAEAMDEYALQGRAFISASEAEPSAANAITAGINADLNPEGIRVNKLTEVSKSEILNLIEPSF